MKVNERASSLADEKMPSFNNVEKEKLHNVLVKFKKEPRVKRHWIKMHLIIFSRPSPSIYIDHNEPIVGEWNLIVGTKLFSSRYTIHKIYNLSSFRFN